MIAALLTALAIWTPPPIMTVRRTAPVLPTIAALREIKLQDGVNLIPAFTEDGRDGLIVKGLRSYMTADGSHFDFFVLTRRKSEKAADHDPQWYVVTAGTDTTSGPGDPELLADTPHTGEDQVKSVRFARARLDGAPAVLLITATRGFENTIPSPSHVLINIYRLRHDDQANGDVFVRLEVRRASACYGNTDLALKDTLGLALPDDYQGPSTRGVCGAE